MKRALKFVLVGGGLLLAAFALLIAIKFGSTAPPTEVMDEVVGRVPAAPPAGSGAHSRTADRVTLPELVYFGAAWQILSREPGMPALLLGGGYANARVERTGDGLYFAGIVERLAEDGRVTDVVLAYGGAQGVGDFIQGTSLGEGTVREEPKWAAVLLDRIWSDPRYAGARVHLTGHSLGAGYALFAGTHAIARHGLKATSRRLDITVFGVPNWGPQSARHYGLDAHVLDGIVTGYTALNDPVITNGGVDRVGISNFLPKFEGLTGIASLFNVVAAHWPTAYMTALGLPSWLREKEKSASIDTVSREFITGRGHDRKYGPPGRLPLIVRGSAVNDLLMGMAGNDRLVGRGGRDELRGGPGSDQFEFLRPSDSGPTPALADRVLDFTVTDRIDLSGMDADTTEKGRQSFVRIRSRSFTAPGQVSVWTEGFSTWIAGNVNRDARADFLISLDGVHEITPANLILKGAPKAGR